MRRLPLVLLLALLLPGSQAQGGQAAFLAEAKGGDADLNAPLKTFQGRIGFLDANVNGRHDLAGPDETLYLDLDSSGTVNYGDVRLSPFGGYGAGTAVDMADADFGRAISSPSNAWFARTEEGTWHYDMDGSRSVSVGDARFTGELPTKVRSGDPRLGTPLVRPEGSQVGMLGMLESDTRGLTTPVYVDVDGFSTGGGRVTPGDLRITPRPSPAPAASGTPSTTTRTVTAPGAASTETHEVTVGGATATSGWRPLDGLLVGLGVVNLAGLVVVWRLLKDTRPRSPFQ